MAGDDDFVPPLDEEWGGPGASPLLAVPPPPPPPPTLGSVCTTGDFYCRLEGGPMGAHFNRAHFPSLPIIAVCSSVVLVAVLVASFLFWRHKTKVQNLLPCKHDPQRQLSANGVTYEDVLINHHPTRIPHPGSQTLMPLELLDVKLGELGPPQVAPLHRTSYYPGGRDPPPFHHPVYEEVSQQAATVPPRAAKGYESDLEVSGGRSLATSEDDFAEDEFSGGQCSASSSVRGSTGGDLCRDPASSEDEEPRRAAPPERLPRGFAWNSQENIYSTIDDDEYRPPRKGQENSAASYGDIRPAFT